MRRIAIAGFAVLLCVAGAACASTDSETDRYPYGELQFGQSASFGSGDQTVSLTPERAQELPRDKDGHQRVRVWLTLEYLRTGHGSLPDLFFVSLDEDGQPNGGDLRLAKSDVNPKNLHQYTYFVQSGALQMKPGQKHKLYVDIAYDPDYFAYPAMMSGVTPSPPPKDTIRYVTVGVGEAEHDTIWALP